MYNFIFNLAVYILFASMAMSHISTHYLPIAQKKIEKIESLVRLVKTQYPNAGKRFQYYKNVITITWVCMCILTKTFYISDLQWFNKSVVRIDKNTYEITYAIGGNLYKFQVKPKRGPKLLIQALDENDADVTSQIQVWLGPYENCHGTAITPAFFGKKELVLSLSTGVDAVFKEDEKITL